MHKKTLTSIFIALLASHHTGAQALVEWFLGAFVLHLVFLGDARHLKQVFLCNFLLTLVQVF